MNEHTSCYKKTRDDWCPSYALLATEPPPYSNMVRVVRCSLLGSNAWRVAVWGADDMGMEIDFYLKGSVSVSVGATQLVDDPEKASFFMFINLLNLEYVDMAILKKMGFVHA